MRTQKYTFWDWCGGRKAGQRAGSAFDQKKNRITYNFETHSTFCYGIIGIIRSKAWDAGEKMEPRIAVLRRNAKIGRFTLMRYHNLGVIRPERLWNHARDAAPNEGRLIRAYHGTMGIVRDDARQ